MNVTPTAFSSPRAQLEAVLFSNESPYFSHNTKISASNSLYFRSYSRKCTYFRYTSFDFLMYFHYSLVPSVTYIFTPGEKVKSNLEVKLCKMCPRGQGQSV